MKPFVVFILSLAFINYAQAGSNESFKISKVSNEEMNMNTYDKDTSAGAVILYDIGTVELNYVQGSERFEYTYNRKTRIKILNANQLEQANQEVNLFIGENDREYIGSIKGSTYNLENGKTVESNLKKDAVFKESIENKYAVIRFAMPNVKVGSIIEYEYTVRSPFIHSLPNWKFQDEIPTVVSSYMVDIPEYFTYRINMKGYLNVGAPTFSYRDATASYTQRVLDVKGSIGGASKSYTVDLDYVMTARKWIVKDVPALTEEPYISCIDNYISQIDFELAKVKYPGSSEVVYSLTWEGVIKQLYENDNVYRQLGKPSAYMTDAFKFISEKSTDKESKMTMAYDFIKNKMSWNYINSKYSNDGLKDAYQKGNGNSADINLLLVRLLKDLDIESYPLVLSTRNNGFVPKYPTVDGFNYLIAYAKIDGKSYLLDATQKSLSPGVLPKRCLNEKGLIIKEKGVEWVDLKTNQEFKIVTSIDAKLSEDGNISGKLFYVKKGYAAIDLRNSMNDSKDKEEYFKDLEKNNSGIKITNKVFQNIDSIDLPTKEIYDFELNSKTQKNDDLVYFSPVFIDQMDENPFKLKERQYPIDYAYPVEGMYIVNLTIPQNYKIEEKPTSVSLSLPNGNGKFAYMLNVVNDNTIQFNYKFSIKKSVFSQDEYIDLKEFYTQVIKKLNEQIVLKKI